MAAHAAWDPLRMNEAALVNTLEKFDFTTHDSNRWLLLRRSRRESILRRAGLLELMDWDDLPIHVGCIVRSKLKYEWGHVTFSGALPEFDAEHPSSVYAAFEFLIRECGILPNFIRMADFYRCAAGQLDTLPVFGSRFQFDHPHCGARRACLNKMMQLLGVRIRKDLLIKRICEVSDDDLFHHYFGKFMVARNFPDTDITEPDLGFSSALDSIDIRHA